MSDFSDTPFVAGSLIGLRAFAVDELGRLRGPSVPDVFKPGENVGRHAGFNMGGAWWMAALTAPSLAAAMQGAEELEKKHQVGSQECTCGFYAYFDGSNDYMELGRVAGLIEGYGRCTVGERGFRAEKARLVALVIPKRRASWRHPAWYDRLADWLYQRGAGGAVGALPGAAGLVATIASLSAAGSSPRSLAALPAGLALIAWAVIALRADFHGISRHYPSVSKDAVRRCHDHTPFKRLELVRRAYPDVPVYETVAEAIAAHPLTPPPPPTPEDEDFWTRGLA